MNSRQAKLLAALQARTDDPQAQVGIIYGVARGIDGIRQRDIDVVREAITNEPVRVGFTPTQRAIYDQVTARDRSLDDQLIALLELRRAGASDEDVRVVRAWLADQILRGSAR
jgi:hypothetical protein